MTRTRSLAGMLVIAALSAACSGPAPVEFTMKDAGEIRQQHEAFVAAFNTKEVSKILDMYAENSVFMPPNQPIIRGKDALRQFYEQLFRQGASDLRMDVAEVAGHGTLAYQSGTYEMALKPATGPAGRDRGKYLFVIRKMGNGWKYNYTMWNSDLPPAAPPPAK
jgi:ketosteroid isomerase-like protein